MSLWQFFFFKKKTVLDLNEIVSQVAKHETVRLVAAISAYRG